VLPDYAQIKRWVQLPVPLSAENDLLTANGRLRRQAILMHYAELADACYCDDIELTPSTESTDVMVAKE
jgi:hypothetical protein